MSIDTTGETPVLQKEIIMLNILFYAYVVVFVLFFFGFCIFIHELGHFLAARWRKLHIVAFSIGFKKIWAYKKNGIEYRIGCLPFGGYVDLPQLDSSGPVYDENKKELPKIKPLDRIIVAFAGPFFNVLFGFFLAFFLWIYGIPSASPVMDSFTVSSINQAGPEYKAGLREGDKIVEINGSKFHASWEKIIQQMIFTIGQIHLGIERDGKFSSIAYTPEINSDNAGMAKEGLPYPFFKPEIPVIISVQKGSPAASYGFETGDRILKIGSVSTPDPEVFYTEIFKVNDLPIVIERGSKVLTLDKFKSQVPDKYKTYTIGVMLDPNPEEAKVVEVRDDSPAKKAGILPGDTIVKVNSKLIFKDIRVSDILNKEGGKEALFTIVRNGKTLEYRITPELYASRQNGLSIAYYNHLNPWEQFVNVIEMSYQSLRGIFSKNSSIKAKHMSGPIGIVTVIGSAVYNGSILHALNIIAIITFSLALLNLLPLPILDGGHILFSLIEMIIRRPLPQSLLKPLCTLFIVLLIALMLFVTFNDVNRLTGFTKIFSKDKSQSEVKK